MRINRTVGLDCHPDSFTAAIGVGAIPDELVVEKVSDSIPIEDLEKWFLKNVSTDSVVVLEASGNSFAVYERLCAKGYRTLVLDSVQVGMIGKSYCNTDKISAVRLVKVYLTGLSDKVWVPDPQTRVRREVFSCYQQAVTDCTRCNNRIKGLLNEHTIRLKKGKKNLLDPDVAQSVMKTRQWTPEETAVLEENLADLQRADSKRNRLRKAMTREILRNDLMMQLIRIFGINKITAYGLIALIGDPVRFSSPKKLATYFGLNPRLKESGKGKRMGAISKTGRKECRTLLVQAAQAVLRCKSAANPLHAWGWKIRFRKHRNVAIVAIARKIAVAVWYLLMGRPFKARENSTTLRQKLRDLAKELGRDEVRSMGFSNYNQFIDSHLKSIELFACQGGHT